MVNLNKSEKFLTNTTAASKYIPKRPRICTNRNPPFQTSLHKISQIVSYEINTHIQRYFYQLNFGLKGQMKQMAPQRSDMTWGSHLVICRLANYIYLVSKIYYSLLQNLHVIAGSSMQILGLLGMYFDAAVVFVNNFSILFRLALAIP